MPIVAAEEPVASPGLRRPARPVMLRDVPGDPPTRASRRERVLARRLRRQDPTVMDELYAEYGRASFGVLLGALRDRELAEDVQQVVFAEVWRRGPSYDPARAGLLTWILTIARSRAIDQLRRRVPEPVAPDAVELLLDGRAGDEDQERAIDRWAVRSLLAQLSDEQQEVLRMRFYDELSQTEIAERLGVPLGTVKARMLRGLKRLRALMDEEAIA